MKAIKYISVLLSVIIVLLLFSSCDFFDTEKAVAYRDARNTYKEGNYHYAAEKFYRLGDYRDAEEQYRECLYIYATKVYDFDDSSVLVHSYRTAWECFVELGEYKDAPEMAEASFALAVQERLSKPDGLGSIGDMFTPSTIADKSLALVKPEYWAEKVLSAIADDLSVLERQDLRGISVFLENIPSSVEIPESISERVLQRVSSDFSSLGEEESRMVSALGLHEGSDEKVKQWSNMNSDRLIYIDETMYLAFNGTIGSAAEPNTAVLVVDSEYPLMGYAIGVHDTPAGGHYSDIGLLAGHMIGYYYYRLKQASDGKLFFTDDFSKASYVIHLSIKREFLATETYNNGLDVDIYNAVLEAVLLSSKKEELYKSADLSDYSTPENILYSDDIESHGHDQAPVADKVDTSCEELWNTIN